MRMVPLVALPAAAAAVSWPWDSAPSSEGGDFMDRYIMAAEGKRRPSADRAENPAPAVEHERSRQEKAATFNLHDEMEKVKEDLDAERRSTKDEEQSSAAPDAVQQSPAINLAAPTVTGGTG